MKRSRKKSKQQVNPSPSPRPQDTALGGGRGGDDPLAKEEERRVDEESGALNWLIDAFSSASLDQINSAYREAGGDPYLAAGILGAHLVDPGETHAAGKKGFGGRKYKRAAAVTGIVPDVIGKGYSKPSAACRDGRRNHAGPLQAKGPAKQLYSSEEAEEFLCSMLGDNSELGMGVVRDVLGQCGYDVSKALDALLDISASSYIRERFCGDYIAASMKSSGICPEISSNNSPRNIISSFQLTDKSSDSTFYPSEKEREFLQYEGYGCRDYMKVLADSAEQPSSRSGVVKADLQQKVLETLFSISDYPKYEPNCMNWKNVVKKVESFGEGMEFCLPSIAEPLKNARNVKGDGYVEFRGGATKHWDAMRNFYQEAATAYASGERAHAAYLSEKGKYHGRLAREADEKASREIFEARNKEIKNTVTIDLHGQHVKQAIGLLKLHLLLFTYIPSIHFLKVITGSGADGVGRGRLKRSVIGLVEKEGIRFNEANVGTLVLQLDGPREYSFVDGDCDSE